MELKSKITLGLKVLALTIILITCYSAGALISGLGPLLFIKSSPGTLIQMFFVFLFPSALITYVILRSRHSGWKLVIFLSLAIYGANTILGHIESTVFMPEILPQGLLLKLFIMGIIVAGIISPLSVLILGRTKEEETSFASGKSLHIALKDIPAKIAIISVVYMLLYFLFGYFIAWKNPLIRNFYSLKDAGNFFTQIAWVWKNTPWMFIFQISKGLLITLFMLPAIRMLRGSSWEVGIITGLLLIIWSGQLFLPNPYLSGEAARIHFMESVPYHLIFGYLMGYLLSQSNVS